jgi:hypothetical protein
MRPVAWVEIDTGALVQLTTFIGRRPELEDRA